MSQQGTLCALTLVNGLLTIFIRVNILEAAESQYEEPGKEHEEAFAGSLELLDLAPWRWNHQRRFWRLRNARPKIELRKRLHLQALFVCLERTRRPVLLTSVMLKQASKTLEIRAPKPGLHDITDRIKSWLDSQPLESGLLTIFCAHTSASLVIQENAARAARHDLERFFEHVAPEDPSLYTHNDEGPDDMPAHIRAALTQTQLSIPVQAGKMVLGTWQGIFLFEHRRSTPTRKIALHLIGEAE